MATSLITFVSIERIMSERCKDKASIQGFIYTLNRKSHDVEYWVCEKRGTCKARLHTRNDQVVKPTDPSEIPSEHSHSSDVNRVDMLKGYSNLKNIARNSNSSTRTLLANSVEGMNAECINKLPKLDSVKRVIRKYKRKEEEYFGNPASCAEIIILIGINLLSMVIAFCCSILVKVIWIELCFWELQSLYLYLGIVITGIVMVRLK